MKEGVNIVEINDNLSTHREHCTLIFLKINEREKVQ